MESITKAQILNAPFLNGERLAEDMGNLLVLAPHPDDESLGCGGLIALLRAAGSSVSIIFVTSGSASHTSLTHPPSLLARIREAEAVKACMEMGVHLANIHFLRAQDSGLKEYVEEDLSDLVSGIEATFEDGNFSSIALPWRRDPHPDHRVVHALGDRVLKRIGRNVTKLEYPIWLWKNSNDEDWPMAGEAAPYKLNIAPVFQKKWRAVKKHRSQLGEIIYDDPNGFVLTEELLEPFNTDTEYFFVTRPDLETLDRTYFDNLYAQQTDPWNFKNSEYELQKYRKSVERLGEKRFGYGMELGCSIGIQTGMLAGICDELMAVDISETAILEAKKNCSHLSNVKFEVADVVKKFPKGSFNLITCCEMGYYLTIDDLEKLFRNISNGLLPNGKLLMVHWTPFVPNYPLSGDAVHDNFGLFAKESGLFQETVSERHEFYRLQVWRKLSEENER